MQVENQSEKDNTKYNGINLLKERKFELNNECDKIINIINESENMVQAKLSSDKQQSKINKYEYLNYINYKINSINDYNNKNIHLIDNSTNFKKDSKKSKSNYMNYSISSSDNLSTGLTFMKLTKEELLLNAEKVINCLDVLNNVFEAYYAYNLWDLIYFNIILYRSFIYPVVKE